VRGSSPQRVLLTGASGFVGKALVSELVNSQFDIRVAVRKPVPSLEQEVSQVVVSDISSSTDWLSMLDSVEVVVHLAARAHILSDTVLEPLVEFREVNTAGTLSLAEQAAKVGVRRFIFISSIGVNGNNNTVPFFEGSPEAPQEAYAISKYEAEQGLLELAKTSDMEVVIIRPPLVYGPNAPGNFGSLVRWMNKSIPLPLGAIHNKRSLVALDNLVNFIALCADRERSPKAANEVFLISDNEDVSTTQLLRKVASAFGKKSWLIPVPVSWMTFAAKLLGKEDVAVRLFSSLQVDSSKARDLLGWKPVITMDEQLKKIADAVLNKKEA